MKKITLSFTFLLIANIMFSQSWTTGLVTATTDSSFQFDIDNDTGLVTMTMNFPDGRWFGLAPNVAAGNAMGDLGDDVVTYSANGLEDRNMPEGTGRPNLDASQDWTLVSNTVSGVERTVVATRAIDTGDSLDYTFPTSETAFPVLFARSAVATGEAFNFHGVSSQGNAGGIVVNATLSTTDFENQLNEIIIFSAVNDADNINIELSNSFLENIEVEIYSLTGNKILTQNLDDSSTTTINMSNLTSGIYLARFKSDNGQQVTKRFLKY